MWSLIYWQYEYFLLDKIGHKQNFKKGIKLVNELSRFINFLIKKIKKDETLIIVSDHGNVEDLSQRPHTFNPVPLIIVNYKNVNYKQKISTLLDFVKLFEM